MYKRIIKIKLHILLKICLLNFKSLVNMSISPLLFLNDKIKFQLFGIFPLSKVDSSIFHAEHAEYAEKYYKISATSA